MNNDDLCKVFNQASKLIESLPQNIQPKAFEVMVSYILKNTSSLQNDIAQNPTLNQHDKPKATEETNILNKISKETNINYSIIKAVYKIDKSNTLQIIAPLQGNNAEKQRQLAYLYFLGSITGFDTEWISSVTFAKVVDTHNASNGHISDTLAKEKAFIRSSGKRKGKEYTLIPSGLEKAKNLVIQLAGNDK